MIKNIWLVIINDSDIGQITYLVFQISDKKSHAKYHERYKKHESQTKTRPIMKVLTLIILFTDGGDTSQYLHTDQKFHTDTQKMTSSRNNDEISE